MFASSKALLYNNYFRSELQAGYVDEYIKFGYLCNDMTL